MSGWIEPPNSKEPGEFWLTRRNADAAPGTGGSAKTFAFVTAGTGKARGSPDIIRADSARKHRWLFCTATTAGDWRAVYDRRSSISRDNGKPAGGDRIEHQARPARPGSFPHRHVRLSQLLEVPERGEAVRARQSGPVRVSACAE